MSWHQNREKLECPGCGKRDYCMVNDDGGEWICMRNSSGRPFSFKSGEVGYLFQTGSPKRVHIFTKPEQKQVTIDARGMWEEALKKTSGAARLRLADQLRLKCSALMELGVAWGEWVESGRKLSAWWFPMRDGHGNVIGLRTRDWLGNKRSVAGSRNGLFIPQCPVESELFIAEGPTDAAALRQMNVYAIGRPSALSGLNELKTFVSKHSFRRVYIIADNDTPKPGLRDVGVDGAETLARHLQLPCCLITLPCKDVRDGIKSGLDHQTLMALAHTAVWVTK